MDNIVRFYGTPLSTLFDRDARFIARVWKEFQKVMGIELKFSTAFYPQINRHSKRITQIREDLLRSCVLDL